MQMSLIEFRVLEFKESIDIISWSSGAWSQASLRPVFIYYENNALVKAGCRLGFGIKAWVCKAGSRLEDSKFTTGHVIGTFQCTRGITKG